MKKEKRQVLRAFFAQNPNEDVIAYITSYYEDFSKTEKKIIDYLTGHLDEFLGMKIEDVTQKTGVSAPTISRFCNLFGVNNIREFKRKVAKSLRVKNRFIDRNHQRATVIDDAIEKIIGNAQRVIYDCSLGLDSKVIRQVASILRKSRMIYIFGSGGGSSFLSQELSNRLFRLGLLTHASSDTQAQGMMCAVMRPHDALMVSSLSGNSSEAVAVMETARKAGCSDIISFAPSQSKVAKNSTFNIGVDISEGVDIFMPSGMRYAFLVAVDVLSYAIAMRIGDDAQDNLRKIKEHLNTTRGDADLVPLGD